MSAVAFLVVPGSPRVPVTSPHDGAKYAVADVACPRCSLPSPLRVHGTGKRIGEDDRSYVSDAVADCCGATIGTIVAPVQTLFGLHEDEAMLLHGRARVYR